MPLWHYIFRHTHILDIMQANVVLAWSLRRASDKPLPDEHAERDARALLDDSIQGAKVPATISDPNTDRRIQEGGTP